MTAEAVLLAPMIVIVSLLVFALVVFVAARVWTSHRIAMAERESDEVEEMEFYYYQSKDRSGDPGWIDSIPY